MCLNSHLNNLEDKVVNSYNSYISALSALFLVRNGIVMLARIYQ